MDENKIEKDAEEAVEAVKDKAEEIKEAVEEKAEAVKEAVEAKAEEVKEAVEAKVEEISDDAAEIAKTVAVKADDADEAVENKAEELKEAIEDKAEEIKEAVEDKVEEVKEAVEDKAEEVKEAVKGKTRKAGIYHDPIKLMTEDSMKAERPAFIIGDTVKVHVRIKEGDRQRIQIFEGTVIALKHGGISETFTVRRTSYGVGVERVFPVNSPNVEKVEVVRHGKTRRAKLYYLRDRVGKSAKLKQKLDR